MIEYHLSPSQISLAMTCRRRWSARYNTHLRASGGTGAGRGKILHDIQEHYLETGQLPEASEYYTMWSPARRHLPEPTTAMTELDLSGRYAGHDWKMYADVVKVEGDKLLIWDLKSSSDPKKYGLGPDELRTDIQAVAYTLMACRRFRMPGAYLSWVYIRTWNPEAKRKPKPMAYPVSIYLPREEAQATYEQRYGKLADELAAEYQKPRLPMAVVPNAAGCRLYPPTGCDYRSLCYDVTDFHRAAAMSNNWEDWNE